MICDKCIFFPNGHCDAALAIITRSFPPKDDTCKFLSHIPEGKTREEARAEMIEEFLKTVRPVLLEIRNKQYAD